jgi:D-alanyl-D-alanine carboxypeptidase
MFVISSIEILEKEAGIFDKIKNPLLVGLMGTGLMSGYAEESSPDIKQKTNIINEQPNKKPNQQTTWPTQKPDEKQQNQTSRGRLTDKTEPKQSELTTIKGVGKNYQFHIDAAKALQELINAARKDGIKDPILLPVSGYRSKAHQERLWQEALKKYKSEQLARKWVAKPGNSAHQTGKAVDFYLGGKNSSGNANELRKLPAYKWLVQNASKYGFVPYYAEPWHWEYNPSIR